MASVFIAASKRMIKRVCGVGIVTRGVCHRTRRNNSGTKQPLQLITRSGDSDSGFKDIIAAREPTDVTLTDILGC
jgi:hypothetical protein